MLLNNYLPVMEIDAQTYEVRADGVLTCEPAKELPMAQRYFLFWVFGAEVIRGRLNGLGFR